MEPLKQPIQSTKRAMCVSPYQSMIVIGAGYFGGKLGGDPLRAAMGGATTAAMVSGVVELAPESVGGHWSTPMQSKLNNVSSMALVGAAAGVLGHFSPF